MLHLVTVRYEVTDIKAEANESYINVRHCYVTEGKDTNVVNSAVTLLYASLLQAFAFTTNG